MRESTATTLPTQPHASLDTAPIDPECQYDACEPENRVVARTLERRWNDKLAEAERLEREHEELKQRWRLELNDLDRQGILDLASDLPKL